MKKIILLAYIALPVGVRSQTIIQEAKIAAGFDSLRSCALRGMFTPTLAAEILRYDHITIGPEYKADHPLPSGRLLPVTFMDTMPGFIMFNTTGSDAIMLKPFAQSQSSTVIGAEFLGVFYKHMLMADTTRLYTARDRAGALLGMYTQAQKYLNYAQRGSIPDADLWYNEFIAEKARNLLGAVSGIAKQ